MMNNIMKKDRSPSDKPKPRAFIGSMAVLFMALSLFLYLLTGCQKAPEPAVPQIAPTPASTQAAPEPDYETDLANSITFMATIVEISPASVTFEYEGAKSTLPITPSTSLIAIQEIGDIKPGANIGIRLSADKKRLLVLNGTWMK